MAEGRAKAEKAFDLFVMTYEAKYPKATECLVKDRGVLLTFYDFPAEHWVHIRSTNPIESTFSTVRLRHGKTKGNGSRAACLTMAYKLMESASKKWRSLNGSTDNHTARPQNETNSVGSSGSGNRRTRCWVRLGSWGKPDGPCAV
jgi:putative transposase